jgi:hypothetical protein
MPGQPDTLARSDFPRQFTLENYRSATARRNYRLASLGRSYVFGEPTVRQIVPSRNKKTVRSCAETVDERSSLWKAEEKRRVQHAELQRAKIVWCISFAAQLELDE